MPMPNEFTATTSSYPQSMHMMPPAPRGPVVMPVPMQSPQFAQAYQYPYGMMGAAPQMVQYMAAPMGPSMMPPNMLPHMQPPMGFQPQYAPAPMYAMPMVAMPQPQPSAFVPILPPPGVYPGAYGSRSIGFEEGSYPLTMMNTTPTSSGSGNGNGSGNGSDNDRTLKPTPTNHSSSNGQQQHQQQLQEVFVPSAKLAAPATVRMWGFSASDPFGIPTSRIPLPPYVIQPTQAVKQYGRAPAQLCPRHCPLLSSQDGETNSGTGSSGSGECPDGSNCRWFHADREYIQKAREMTEPFCCAAHNDYFSREMLKNRGVPHLTRCRFLICMEAQNCELEIPLTALSLTLGLDHLSMRGESRIIRMGKQPCRLHYEGKCGWGKDCSNVHVCRRLMKMLLETDYPTFYKLFALDPTTPEQAAKFLRTAPPLLLEFLRSESVVPLLEHLINLGGRRMRLAEVLLEFGANATEQQRQMLYTESQTTRLLQDDSSGESTASPS